jgi:acyl-CoA thioester hydrolase
MTPERPTRKDFAYFHEMTTRWRDNDVYNHVNNAVFYEYVDTGVNAWIKLEAGLDVPDAQIVGLVVNSSCNFFAPLSFPGHVTAGVCVARIGRSSVTYRVGLFADNAEIAASDARFTHVYVDRETREPMPLPSSFREALGRILSPS